MHSKINRFVTVNMIAAVLALGLSMLIFGIAVFAGPEVTFAFIFLAPYLIGIEVLLGIAMAAMFFRYREVRPLRRLVHLSPWIVALLMLMPFLFASALNWSRVSGISFYVVFWLVYTVSFIYLFAYFIQERRLVKKGGKTIIGQ